MDPWAIKGGPTTITEPVGRVWHLWDATTRRGFWTLDWEVKREDCWVGAFWRTYRDETVWERDVWVCLLPCLPLHLYITRRHEEG